MKETYEELEMETIVFITEDIICASGQPDPEEGDPTNPMG